MRSFPFLCGKILFSPSSSPRELLLHFPIRVQSVFNPWLKIRFVSATIVFGCGFAALRLRVNFSQNVPGAPLEQRNRRTIFRLPARQLF